MDGRLIPPCVVCRRHSCADPAGCRSRLLPHTRPRGDSRDVRPLGDDMSAFVLTPDEYRAGVPA